MRTRKGFILTVAAVVVILALGLFVVIVRADENPFTPPAGAVKIGVIPLPCEGTFTGYDTDGDPTNGAEFAALVDKDGHPRATLIYGPGEGGPFLRATVQRPGGPVEVFTSASAFNTAYPHPCGILLPVKKV